MQRVVRYSFFIKKGNDMSWQPKDELARAVAFEVLLHGPLGRSEIARRLSLAPATITRISSELISTGLLMEVPDAVQRTSGRPSIPLDIIPDSHYFLGIKLGDESIMASVIDLKAQVRATRVITLDETRPADVVARVAALAGTLKSAYTIDAIGIAVGGIVADMSTVLSAPFLKWQNVPLARLIREASGLPTFIANDLSAYTQAEHWFGAGVGHRNFAVLTLGIGVGYGCVANDERLENTDSGIGLVGHWPLDPYGPICSQGHRGCAESLLTTPAICREASAALGKSVDWNQVTSLFGTEPAINAILARSGRALGRLIGMIAALTSPELVVLGGEGVDLAVLSGESLKEGISGVRDPRARPIDIEINADSNRIWSRGAGVIAIQGYIASRGE